MNFITKHILLISALGLLLFAATPVRAQGISSPAENERAKKSFTELLTETGLSFNFPEGFREIRVPTSDVFPFCYGMDLPGEGFEIWMRISTQREGEKLLADKNIHLASSDSLYVHLAQDQIGSFTSEKNFLRRVLPNYILRRYNADAGSTYLLSLNDTKATKHYKYALLTVIQKNQSGVVMAVFFTNDKGPDFFRDMNKAASCLKFKD